MENRKTVTLEKMIDLLLEDRRKLVEERVIQLIKEEKNRRVVNPGFRVISANPYDAPEEIIQALLYDISIGRQVVVRAAIEDAMKRYADRVAEWGWL